jgi:hypothetical protein
MPFLAIIGALVQGITLINGVIPSLDTSQTVQDIEAALALLSKVVPSIQSIINLLQSPTPITQAQADAAVALMNQHVTDWDNRAKK